MGSQNGSEGSGGPGALLWGLSLGRWVTTQAQLCCSFTQVQSRHPGSLGWLKGSLLHSTLRLERGSQSRAESPGQGHPSGHLTRGMLREGGSAAQGQLLAAATRALALGRILIWKGAEIYKPLSLKSKKPGQTRLKSGLSSEKK